MAAPKPVSHLRVPMIPAANSKALAGYGYHEGEQVLALQFRAGGPTYHYRGVSPGTFTELVAAESRGSFVQKNIVGKFPTALYEPEPK